MEPIEHRARMQPRPDAPPGIETDGEGRVIPVEQRTLDHRVAARADGVKDPEQEAENPAPMPEGATRGSPLRPANDDPAGQQGGTQGGGRDSSPPQP